MTYFIRAFKFPLFLESFFSDKFIGKVPHGILFQKFGKLTVVLTKPKQCMSERKFE